MFWTSPVAVVACVCSPYAKSYACSHCLVKRAKSWHLEMRSSSRSLSSQAGLAHRGLVWQCSTGCREACASRFRTVGPRGMGEPGGGPERWVGALHAAEPLWPKTPRSPRKTCAARAPCIWHAIPVRRSRVRAVNQSLGTKLVWFSQKASDTEL